MFVVAEPAPYICRCALRCFEETKEKKKKKKKKIRLTYLKTERIHWSRSRSKGIGTSRDDDYTRWAISGSGGR